MANTVTTALASDKLGVVDAVSVATVTALLNLARVGWADVKRSISLGTMH